MGEAVDGSRNGPLKQYVIPVLVNFVDWYRQVKKKSNFDDCLGDRTQCKMKPHESI